MTDLLPRGNYVFANWGRWLVMCSSPFCMGAMQVWPGQTFTACGDCGWPIEELIWPADPEGVETILRLRPDEKTRNWQPGETLQDLLVENAAHGILPAAIDWQGGVQELMSTRDDVLVGGLVGLQIRSEARRHQIEGALHGVDDAAHRS